MVVIIASQLRKVLPITRPVHIVSSLTYKRSVLVVEQYLHRFAPEIPADVHPRVAEPTPLLPTVHLEVDIVIFIYWYVPLIVQLCGGVGRTENTWQHLKESVYAPVSAFGEW